MSSYEGDQVNMSTVHLLSHKSTLVRNLMKAWGDLHSNKSDDDLQLDPFYGKLTVRFNPKWHT